MRQDFTNFCIETSPAVTDMDLSIISPITWLNPEGKTMVSAHMDLYFDDLDEARNCYQSIMEYTGSRTEKKECQVEEIRTDLLIHFRGFDIDTWLFRPPVLVQDYSIIAFTSRPEVARSPLTLNLRLKTPMDSLLTYNKIRRSMESGEKELDLRNVPCTWPKDLAGLLNEYTRI